MVEAMLEVVLANYFRKIQSNFELVVTEKIPILSTLKMYASESHFKCEFSLFFKNTSKSCYDMLAKYTFKKYF